MDAYGVKGRARTVEDMSSSPWSTDPFAPRSPASSVTPGLLDSLGRGLGGSNYVVRVDAPEVLHAWTDGAAKGNPGPASWAWYVSDDCWSAGGWASATNNLAELTAVAELLDATAHLLGTKISVTTDSTYVHDALTKWVNGWERNGWKTRDGSPVKNSEVIRRIREHTLRRDVEFHWTKGHASNEGNNAADMRCSAYAQCIRDGRMPDSGPGLNL